ncbi:S41 family peptidase [Streptacidiphilus cavernicola]|uniref:S41 family peptidase n=1 Tax=Streptacidiphilus cavernicola TaxID=3342716 RepID=A0ABV6VZT8_9ACTN
MSRSHSRLRLQLALGLVFAAVLATGATAGAWGSESPRSSTAAAVDAAARRWVADSGDRWAAYYGPEQYAAMAQALDGRYAGVGLWVVRSPAGVVTVSRVRGDGPAARASVRAGEQLTAVDGRPVTGLPVTEVVALLRGDSPLAGSTVTLALRRGSAAHSVTLRRQLLDAQDVVVDRPAAGITRIAVSAFTGGTGDLVEAAVHQSADRRGRGILLDLRGDSGGLVDESVEAASSFLDGGPVGSYQDGDTVRRLTAEPGGDTAVPLVVLVDGGTMSAAELLTGALQDRDRAVVVGSRTFGKGAVQQATPLPGGAAVERTVGHYRTPDGRDLDGTGITPDVEVPPSAGPQAAERTAITVLDDLAGLSGSGGG